MKSYKIVISVLAAITGVISAVSLNNIEQKSSLMKSEGKSTFVYRIGNPNDLRIKAVFEVAEEVPYKRHHNYNTFQAEWSLMRKNISESMVLMFDMSEYVEASVLQANLENLVSRGIEARCLILSGNQVSKLHLDETGRVLGLECLVLDSCEPSSPLLKRFEESHPHVKLIYSQRRYIEELNSKSPSPTRILLEKLQTKPIEYIDDEHLYRVVEICRNRQVLPTWGPPIAEPMLKNIPHLNTLRSLDLSETKVDNDFLKRLTNLKRLEILRLDSTKVDEEGLEELHLSEISRLNLSKTKVDGRLPSMPNLEVLDLSSTGVGDEFCADGLLYPKLQVLDLSDTPITNQGVQKCSSFQKLAYLTLDAKWSNDNSTLSLLEKGIEIQFIGQEKGVTDKKKNKERVPGTETETDAVKTKSKSLE